MKILMVILATAIMLFTTACSKEASPRSSTIVLVHGAWQGAYVWQNVKAQLEQKEYKVVVVELPAHGDDNTSPAAVSINAYRDKVISAINGVNGKVILVGHSMGGMVISATAEKIPTQIEKLVYVAAYVPISGQSLRDLAGQDAQSELGPALILSQNQLTLDIKVEKRIPIFCQDGPDAVKKLLTDKFRVEPAIPFTNPVSLTTVAFGSVSKYYIQTTQDKAIGINLQKQMISSAGITKVFSINSGHSPFLSQPDSLSAILLDILK